MKSTKSQRHPEDLKSDKHLHMLVFGRLRMVVRNRGQSIWRSHNLRETQIQRLWLKVRDRLGLEVCASISCLVINLGRSRGHNLEAGSARTSASTVASPRCDCCTGAAKTNGAADRCGTERARFLVRCRTDLILLSTPVGLLVLDHCLLTITRSRPEAGLGGKLVECLHLDLVLV